MGNTRNSLNVASIITLGIHTDDLDQVDCACTNKFLHPRECSHISLFMVFDMILYILKISQTLGFLFLVMKPQE